jgi:isocitrate dehydrogenase kinase/phosphatase
MLEHKHTISKPLVEALERLYTQFQQHPVNIKYLNLDRTSWDNFQKLAYFGLTSKHYMNAVRVAGEWFITDKGALFIQGKLAIPRSVWTYRGSVVQRESKRVYIDQVIEGYKTVHEYREDSRPHNDKE